MDKLIKFINSKIMKIKRTLPSVEEQPFNFNRLSLNRSSNEYLDRSADKYISISQFQNIHKQKNASTTFSKTMSELSDDKGGKNRHKVQKINDSSKRTVTFANTDNENQKNEKMLQNRSKSRQRIPIFANSPVKKRNQDKSKDKAIASTLNIQQLSNRLKANRTNDESKIINKISQLQNAVLTIQNQLSDSKKSAKKPSSSGKKDSLYLQSSVYRLQLEQAKRCERLAKQNQILYQNLIKGLEKQNSIKNSQKKNRLSNSKKNSAEKYRITESRKRSGPKITAFEDLQKYERENAYRQIDESEGFLEIASPFYLQDNKGKIKLKK